MRKINIPEDTYGIHKQYIGSILFGDETTQLELWVVQLENDLRYIFLPSKLGITKGLDPKEIEDVISTLEIEDLLN